MERMRDAKGKWLKIKHTGRHADTNFVCVGTD